MPSGGSSPPSSRHAPQPAHPRQIRRHVISYQDVCRANLQVTRELEKLGFWSDRLNDVDVYWVSASWRCYGWCQGHIYIPAISGANLSNFILGTHVRLTDVLRHEWSHALADRWPSLIATRRFAQTFCGDYESVDPVSTYDPDRHLTHYSTVMPCEDFAEVFHFYLRHKGRLPVRLANKPEIVKKWRFMDWMAERITKGTR
ncbi:MAG: hypothetical protein ABIT37_22585 [Luteolibacter sp.]